MKFQNGCWLLKEGFASFSPQQIYSGRITGEEVVLCAPTAVVNGRGNTIDGINLTLRITAPMPEVIRVQTWHELVLRPCLRCYESYSFQEIHISKDAIFPYKLKALRIHSQNSSSYALLI